MALRHVHGGVVSIEFPTGIATIGRSDVPIRPLLPSVAVASKVPLFFRRKTLSLDKPGSSVRFRAVGFVVFQEGRPVNISAIRVFDDRIDRVYQTNWESEVARHTASHALVLA